MCSLCMCVRRDLCACSGAVCSPCLFHPCALCRHVVTVRELSGIASQFWQTVKCSTLRNACALFGKIRKSNALGIAGAYIGAKNVTPCCMSVGFQMSGDKVTMRSCVWRLS